MFTPRCLTVFSILVSPRRDLDGPDVAGCPIDHCCLRSPKRMCSIFRLPQADSSDPLIDGSHIWRVLKWPVRSTRLGNA